MFLLRTLLPKTHQLPRSLSCHCGDKQKSEKTHKVIYILSTKFHFPGALRNSIERRVEISQCLHRRMSRGQSAMVQFKSIVLNTHTTLVRKRFILYRKTIENYSLPLMRLFLVRMY